MKALTVCNPWPYLILERRPEKRKQVENRTWSTPYRGELLIHAGKSREYLEAEDLADYPDMKFGFIVGLVTLVACLHIEHVWPERYNHLRDHEHAHGPYCWVLEHPRRLPEPLEIRGYQQLWTPPAWVLTRLSMMKLESL